MRVTLALLVSTVVIAAARPQQSPLSPVHWMSGCWELRQGNRVVLEMWMPPDADLMLGASRTVVGGAVREFERLQVRATNGKFVYTAFPSGQAETSFTSIEQSDTTITFENPTHDFPQRILYRKRGADSLIAGIEGTTPGGARRIVFPMRRVDCVAR